MQDPMQIMKELFLVNNDETGSGMEIWNNVFIQFNRLMDGSLESIPQNMLIQELGLERLRKWPGKTSNYDTDYLHWYRLLQRKRSLVKI
jgi:alanyl-tRNA synthetase